jgi:membrane complex biogenesis BtpA family protein
MLRSSANVATRERIGKAATSLVQNSDSLMLAVGTTTLEVARNVKNHQISLEDNMKTWVEDLFGVKKPIIAMCHLGSLPGDPYYDPAAGMAAVIAWAKKDLEALQNGGVDGLMFSNEFSMPYLTKVPAVTVACMARVIGEIMDDLEIPFGVNVLWDPYASLDLAAATGARFVRELFSGVYASDFGLWDTNTGEVVRHRQAISAGDVRLLFNIVPEAAQYLTSRDVAEIARTTVFNHRPDALCISGLTAGSQTDTSLLRKVKEAVPDTLVFANTGVRAENVVEQLSIADGAVVGTTFKSEGVFENHVDEARVAAFMKVVRQIREGF